MWFIRRMMRVLWIERVKKQEVLWRASAGRELWPVVKRRQLRFLGHVLKGDGLKRNCLLGMIEGRRARGRQFKYMDGIKKISCSGEDRGSRETG